MAANFVQINCINPLFLYQCCSLQFGIQLEWFDVNLDLLIQNKCNRG